MRPRILIAEEDTHLRNLYGLLVRRMGNADYTAVSDGADALAHLRNARFDVVVLDLMMPRVNGYDVVDAIARMPRPWPAVIVISAAPNVRSLHPEVVTFIVHKPFDMDLLAAILSEIAERMAAQPKPAAGITARSGEPEFLQIC